MILFLEDWAKYPTAIPHYTTTNKTWLKLAGVYNKMGVTNCLYMLALHNPLLKDIDPHSKDLTHEQITMIVDECAENPWYALREIIRVPPVSGVNSLPLRANRGNIALYWLFFNHVTTMLIQTRQTGKSISVDSLMVILLTILTVNTNISLLTKDDQLRVKNVKRLKDLMTYLPNYLQLKTKKDSNNTEKITLESLGNTYITSVAQASKKAALNLGRGGTNAVNHIDEIAFVNNIKTTLPALLAAGGAARDEAAASGAPYGNVFTSTPGYLATESGAFAYDIYNSAFRWTELMYDCTNEEDLHRKIELNSPSKKLLVLLDYNHRQLGYSDEWLRNKISDAMATGSAAEADFLGIWPDGAGSSLISPDNIKIIVSNRRIESNPMISTYGYIIKWYIPLDKIKNHSIIAGLDTSDAVGSDGIGLVMRDVSTGEVLGTGDFNETNTITFANWLATFLIEYPDVLLIVERRSTGTSIMDAIIEVLVLNNVDPFKRLFNWVVNDSAVKKAFAEEVIDVPMRHRDPVVYTKYRKYFGFATSGVGRTSRTILYGEIFSTSLSYTADTVRDTKLINQLTGLVIKNDRIDHSARTNDDLVIAWLLAYWVLAKATNLSFYGIAPNKVLTTVAASITEEQGGSEAVANREYQLGLKADIDDLADTIRAETSPVRSKMLLARLRYLYRDIDTTIIRSFNIEALIEGIELDKRKLSSTRYYQ